MVRCFLTRKEKVKNVEDRYLFKAKRIDNGEWVEWNALAGMPHNTNIKGKTICQCTGLKDKNGKLIWENDIVKDEKGNLYTAFWQDNHYQFSWICIKSNTLPVGAKWDFYSIRRYEIEVIGNRFDNPDLLRQN